MEKKAELILSAKSGIGKTVYLFVCLFLFWLSKYFFYFFCFWLWFGLVLKKTKDCLSMRSFPASSPCTCTNPRDVSLSLQNSPIQPLHLFANLLSRVVSAAALLNLLLFFIVLFSSHRLLSQPKQHKGPFGLGAARRALRGSQAVDN